MSTFSQCQFYSHLMISTVIIGKLIYSLLFFIFSAKNKYSILFSTHTHAYTHEHTYIFTTNVQIWCTSGLKWQSKIYSLGSNGRVQISALTLCFLAWLSRSCQLGKKTVQFKCCELNLFSVLLRDSGLGDSLSDS